MTPFRQSVPTWPRPDTSLGGSSGCCLASLAWAPYPTLISCLMATYPSKGCPPRGTKKTRWPTHTPKLVLRWSWWHSLDYAYLHQQVCCCSLSSQAKQVHLSVWLWKVWQAKPCLSGAQSWVRRCSKEVLSRHWSSPRTREWLCS